MSFIAVELTTVGFIQNATANAIYGVGLIALCINDFSLFYFDHSFANAAKPRSRSRGVRGRVLYKQTFKAQLIR